MPNVRRPLSSDAVRALTLPTGDTAHMALVALADSSGNVIGENSFQFAGATGGIVNTSDVAIAAAAGAGVRNFLTSIQFKNTAAVASEIVIKDGSTIIWRGHVSASMTISDGWNFNPPLKGSANTALNVAMLTTATATIVSAQGYTGA